ncbi:SNF2-related protein [Caulobacter sp. RL271]|uniref:DEAD/DEAH box helicase n=1 Tax=Caulobacter segnis TaxID=88688 RepID=A0ABY4ZXH2_9CAUL|nr:DEAD/DEAH box helicase [Caulobacter segnis]USQ97258.1 DEAD/DEAH box helicase [Caulobacter segnis]
MRTYGNLALVADQWVINDLEPHVAIKLKALFPGVPKANKVVTFPATPLIAADLGWFCERYPLRASNDDLNALDTARTAFAGLRAEADRIRATDYTPPLLTGLREGQALREHQARNIELLGLFGGLLVGDEVGKGKTYTAAGAMLLPGALPAAVVVLPSLKRQWQNKIQQFTHLTCHLVEGGSPYELPPADVRIFSYMTLAGWADMFGSLGHGLVVWDEIHELRAGLDTEKGKASMRLGEAGRYRLGLTATPIFNYGTEIWNIMRFLRPEVLGERGDFLREFAPHGSVDGKALGAFLRDQNAFVRERKDDPQPVKVVQVLEGYDEGELEAVEGIARALAHTAATGAFRERGEATRELDLRVRHATGVAKARAVARVARILVEGGAPILLFGWHREVYDIWLEELADLAPAMFTGSETPRQKAAAQARFLNGETDILIMSLRSGAGLDGLQARCSTVVFGELDWSPGQHHQCVGRVDREGQPHWERGEGVLAIYLVVEDGSDPPMLDVLGLKASEAHAVVDPDLGVQAANTDETRLRGLVQRYLDRTGAGEAGQCHEA